MKINKTHIVRIAAVLLGIGGAISFVLCRSHPIVKTFGMVAVVISVILLRITKNMDQTVEFGDAAHVLHAMVTRPENASNGPGVVAWVLSAIAVLAIAVSYWLMRQDALNGGHQAWPADAFAGSAFFAAVVFGYIGAKLTRKQ